MSAAGLTFDVSGFTSALNEYVAGSSRDAAVVLNTVAADIGFDVWTLGGARSGIAADSRNEIQNLPQSLSQRYWLRIVAKKLRGQNVAATVRGLKAAHRKSQKTGGVISPWNQLMADKSRAMIGSRIAALGFTAMPFLKAAQVLKKNSAGGGGGKKFALAQGWARNASPSQGDRLEASLFMAYAGKNKGAAELGRQLLQQAMTGKAVEMRNHIAERLAKNARKIRGRGRR